MVGNGFLEFFSYGTFYAASTNGADDMLVFIHGHYGPYWSGGGAPGLGNQSDCVISFIFIPIEESICEFLHVILI